MWIICTQLAALSPGHKHTPGIWATGFLPFTGPARDAVGVAFRRPGGDAQNTEIWTAWERIGI